MRVAKKHPSTGTVAAKAIGQVHVVKVPWRGQSNYWWNEACASVLEVFGLPGERYTSHPTMDFMAFHFASKKDADMCRILISENL